MDISKTKRNSKDELPDHIAPYRRGTTQYSGSGGTGGMRRPSYDEMRQQFEDVKEMNRVQRGQLQVSASVGVVCDTCMCTRFRIGSLAPAKLGAK
jgi:hypothetical protein